MQIKSTQLCIWQMAVKIQKYNFLCIFKLMLKCALFAMGQRIHLYGNFSWAFFICLTSFFQCFDSIILTDKLHNFEEGICFANNGCHGKWKKKFFFTHNSNVCYGQKKFHRKRESYRFILTLKKLGLLDQCDLK